MGAIVNAAAILVGALGGLLLKRGISERLRTTLMQAMGLGVLFVGLSTALGNIQDAQANPVLFIVSLALGGLVGEWIDIDGRLLALGALLEKRIAKGEANFSRGFVSATLLFCVGTMAIIGSIQSGAQGDHTTLFTKAIIDGISALLLASALGFGVAFSAVSVLAYQGLITLLAAWIAPYLTAGMLVEISIVGGILIAALGLNMLEMVKIKVANLLPGILIPVIYYIVVALL